MEAPEVPLESVQEHINEHAHHAHSEGGEGKRWVLGVALSSAMFAALAAVASLLAGHHVNEALIAQIDANNQTIKASDKWSYYQAKGIKGAVLATRIELTKTLDKPVSEKDEANVKRYEDEQKEITKEAQEFEQKATEIKEEGERHLTWHVMLARAVTMFQVSIAVAAISVLVNKRAFWFVSMVFGGIGVYFFVMQLISEFAKHA